MVDQFEGCEFWLPSEFLNDDDFSLNLEKSRNVEDGKKQVGDLFSGSNSDMGSPTESESDEDDYVNGLTSKMENSTLGGKVCRLPSSPKSPLCKAAGEFSRRKMVQESTGLSPGPNVGFKSNHPPQLSYQQLQAVTHLQFEQFRRRQMMIQAQQNRGVKNDARNPMGLPVSGWPPLQRSQAKPQPMTGMRTVFSGPNPGCAKKQCAGTGVFLPRTVSSTRNCKNKSGCSSPVLIPDRVVQALGVQKKAQHLSGCYTNTRFSDDYGAGLKYNNKNKTNLSVAKAERENQEVIRLLPEWTY